MIVLWIQVQLKKSNVKEKVLKHVDEVVSIHLKLFYVLLTMHMFEYLSIHFSNEELTSFFIV